MFEVLGITFKISCGMFTGWILETKHKFEFGTKGSEYCTILNFFSWGCEIYQKCIITVFLIKGTVI